MSRAWPTWQPGGELRAEDLLGLEDYLLSRHLFNGNDWGVDKIAQDSVVITVEENTATVTVNAVRGLTRGGQPVIVESSIPQTFDIKLASNNTLDVDVALQINEPTVESKSEMPIENGRVRHLDSKITLHVESDCNAEQRQSLQVRKNGLYLGSYRWKSGETWLRKKPRVRSLVALEDFPDWREWTQPLVCELGKLVVQHSRPHTEVAAQMASQQLLLALHRWKHLTVSEWTHLANILHWAETFQPHGWESQAFKDTDRINTHDWQGEDLPKNIIALIHGLLEQGSALGPELLEGKDYDYKKIRGKNVIFKLANSLQGSYLRLGLSTLNGVGEGRLPQLTQPDNEGFTPQVGKKVGDTHSDGYMYDKFKVNVDFEFVVKNLTAKDASEIKLYKPIT